MTNFEKFKKEITVIRQKNGFENNTQFRADLTQFAVKHGLELDLDEILIEQVTYWLVSDYKEELDVDKSDCITNANEFKLFVLLHKLGIIGE